MADSTVADLSKMKVVELRKELKARGLTYVGDKSDLVSRLQEAMNQDTQDDHADITLDSDELDSDGVLDDEDDKSQNDIALDDPAVELALAEQPEPPKVVEPVKTLKTLKRKPVESAIETDAKKEGAKKIVLNRATSITTITSNPTNEPTEANPKAASDEIKSNKVKITVEGDTKAKLESRAIRFGLPISKSDAERKEARKLRFGLGGNANTTTETTPTAKIATGTLSENLEKLKKRAERFGQSVSKIMTDIEIKERVEKRKAKFGTVK